jgi:hypothetical protein
MEGEKPNVVALPSSGDDLKDVTVGGTPIPAPPPGAHLSTQGRRLYRWLCEALIEDGRSIRAAGMQIVMLVHTFEVWSKDMKDCIELGRYGTSENGNRYELPHSYNERNAREQIKRELPEACLTVMSQIEARLKESKISDPKQDDLFEELLGHARSRPHAA